MLDIQLIRDNPDLIKRTTKNRNAEADIDELLRLDEERRRLQARVEELRGERNRLSASNQGGKPNPETVAAVGDIKAELAEVEPQLQTAESQYRQLLLQVPNLDGPDVPVGEDDEDNQVVKTVGEPTAFDFEPRDHLDLGHRLDLIDTETAARVSGARFYYLKNEAVLLEFALIQWLLHKYVARGFTPVTTPQLVQEHMMVATGFFPADRHEIYQVNQDQDEDLYLIGTSEVPLAGLHMFEPLPLEQLPKRYIGFSSCFRREAGSYGRDTHGILRVHQFDKLEMYSFVHPDNSWEEHEFLLEMEEEILQELGLPYQVVNICTGDLGPAAAKKYDCEVWIPTQGKYRELTSCSNTTDYQARRGGIKYRDQAGRHYLHTLNGTAMASTRTLIAIMENYQTEDGTVRIPEVLQPYMGKDTIGDTNTKS